MSLLGRSYQVPPSAIATTVHALRSAGSERLEGVVLWIGARARDPVPVVEAYTPPQIAYRNDDGVAVQIPDDVIASIIAALPSDLAVVCRVHSHPQDAYHSETDDLNLLLSHAGAISIVVPWFASRGLHLEECSVNELGGDFRWRELPIDEVERRFTIEESA